MHEHDDRATIFRSTHIHQQPYSCVKNICVVHDARSVMPCAYARRFMVQGKTILYIPQEEALGDAKAAAKQKDLVQRLESTIIHWTRQIKEVVNQQVCI